jgi:hypothetical protein
MTTNVMRGSLPSVRWSAVLAGVAMALAAQIVLGLVGAALGYAAEARDSRSLGIVAGSWSVMAAFTAALVGAIVTCRIVAASDHRTAWLHGSLVWCLGIVAGAVFLSGPLAGSLMGVSYVWNGGIVSTDDGRNLGAGSPIDSAARDAAVASLLGAAGALAGLVGSLVGAAIARLSVAHAALPVREGGAYSSSLMPPPNPRRREEPTATEWSDPVFDRRGTVLDRRQH